MCDRPRDELLQVALDLVRRTLARDIRILADVLAGPALPQQVPGLVQLPLQRVEPSTVGTRQSTLVAQTLFLGDELMDLVEYCVVVHGAIVPGLSIDAESAIGGSLLADDPGGKPPVLASPGLGSPRSRPDRFR